MKNSITEPPGRFSASSTQRSSNVISLKKIRKQTQPLPMAESVPAIAKYASIDSMVAELRPALPVHCLRLNTITATAKWFVRHFPGDVLYAVKTNPDPYVIGALSRAGVRHFDVASIAEIRLVGDMLPNAKLYYMHPVKSRESIAEAYFSYGVRDFSLDSHEELQKILEVTGHAPDLNLYVRLSMPNDQAVYSLSGKFGVKLEQAASLIQATRKASDKFGICFHVGSQCMNPNAYANAMQTVVDLLTQIDVRLDMLDIGGGFPSVYPGITPPPLGEYMKSIKRALKTQPQLAECQVLCEPGRALVAEGGSVVVRVELRKDNMLYINDGTYGTLFDAGGPGFSYPVKAIRPQGQFSEALSAFGFFGPTCDSLDMMKGPFYLPDDIAEGDWIEIGQLGSYGKTMATRFNGFYSDHTVEVSDKPLLSLFGMN